MRLDSIRGVNHEMFEPHQVIMEGDMMGRKAKGAFLKALASYFVWSQTINLSSIRLLAVTPASFPEEIVFLPLSPIPDMDMMYGQ